MSLNSDSGQTTYRVRRGRTVEIPEAWRGVVTYQQTIRKRLSKTTRKMRNRRFARGWGDNGQRKRQEERAPKMEEWDA